MNVLLVVLTIVYPFLVYLGLSTLSPGLFGICITLLIVLRLRMVPNIRRQVFLLAAGVLACYGLGILWRDSETLLLLYPALLNFACFCVFAWSLFHPPSLIERLSRAAGMEVSGPGVPYTRGVTVLWCGFFVINGLLAATTALFASRATWALYNGFIAYLAMGLLFLAEYAYRKRYQRLHRPDPGHS